MADKKAGAAIFKGTPMEKLFKRITATGERCLAEREQLAGRAFTPAARITFLEGFAAAMFESSRSKRCRLIVVDLHNETKYLAGVYRRYKGKKSTETVQ